MIDALTAACGAWNFHLAASARISLLSVRSETAHRSRSFSLSRCLLLPKLLNNPVAELVAPAVVSLIDRPKPADRIDPGPAPTNQNHGLPRLGLDLVWFVSFVTYT